MPRLAAIGEYVGLYVIYLGLALLLAWPVPALFAREVLGHPALSVKVHLWQYWWTEAALLSPNWDLLHSPLLYHPCGSDTLAEFGNFLLPLLGAPLAAVGGVAVAYNAVTFLAFAGSGLAAYALCRRFVTSRAACFVGGAAFEFLPYAWRELTNGAIEIAVLFWLPVCLLQSDRCLQRPTLRNGLLLGLLLFLSSMTSWYYGLYLTMACALTCVVRCAWLGREGRAAWPVARPVMLAFCAALALHGALMLPFVPRVHQTVRVHEGWKSATLSRDPAREANPDLLEFLGPWQKPSAPATVLPNLEKPFRYPFVVFPGFVTVALGLLGLAARRRIPAYLLVLMASFWLLAMGLWLSIAGRTNFLSFRIPLPAFFLSWAWSGFGATTLHSYRAVAIPSLVLCVLASQGFSVLLAALDPPRGRRVALAGLASALVVLDVADCTHLGLPLPRTRALPADLYTRLGAIPGEGAVIDLPPREQTHMVGEYMLAQTGHGRPIMSGRSFEPCLSRLRGNFIEALEGTEPLLQDPDQPSETLRLLLTGLKKEGFRFLIVHWSWLSPHVDGRVRALTSACCRPVDEDRAEDVTIFEILDGAPEAGRRAAPAA